MSGLLERAATAQRNAIESEREMAKQLATMHARCSRLFRKFGQDSLFGLGEIVGTPIQTSEGTAHILLKRPRRDYYPNNNTIDIWTLGLDEGLELNEGYGEIIDLQRRSIRLTTPEDIADYTELINLVEKKLKEEE